MSMSLYLTKYSKIEDQKYSEEDSKNLEIVEISDDIYRKLIKEYVCEKDFWEKGEEECYSQEIILDADMDKIIKKCVLMSKDLMREILEKDISQKEEDDKLDIINIVLEIRSILNKKKKKYTNQDDIFIIVG